jgi:hydrogenase maturation protease
LNHILVTGYGNPDRQDDGVAWHILCALATKLGYIAPSTYEDEFPTNNGLDFAFSLQLTPEMAEEIAAYERVCFVDAHTGDIPQEVQMIPVESEFQRSPFTHHLTPQSLLSMCETLYNKKPEAALLSVRGYHFGFERELSAETGALVPQAVELIMKWLDAPPVVQ